jgi:hypothetical protein
LRLSPHTAELLRAAAVAGKVPAWRVVERAILAAHDGTSGAEASPAAPESGSAAQLLPPEALEIAQECAAFLDAQVDRAAAVKALRRAWKQAVALAGQNLRTLP